MVLSGIDLIENYFSIKWIEKDNLFVLNVNFDKQKRWVEYPAFNGNEDCNYDQYKEAF